MHIVTVGLNYRTAPVQIREKFAIAETELPQALDELKQISNAAECVMVGTCNRTEIYVVDRSSSGEDHIYEFIERWFGISRDEFGPYLYKYKDHTAVEHLFKVTSGLDSMIIGETQILGQVRTSFLSAQKLGFTSTVFNTLFKQVITFAKRAHAETAIGENPVSISYAAVELGKRIFGSYAGKTVMMIGAGKMGELTVKHLHSNGADKVIIVNRTYEHALDLANKFNGIASSMEDCPRYLSETDIVISSTGSSSFVLRAEQVNEVMNRRKSRPIFMIDIAVPRDLDPAIGDLSGAFLYDIDDLEMIVESNLQERKKEAEKIEDMIGQQLAVFEQWHATLEVNPAIHALQAKANSIHEETMTNLFNRLPNLSEREMKLISKLSKSAVNQMLRDPILRVKEMSADNDRDKAIEMFTRLFALEEEEQRPDPIIQHEPAKPLSMQTRLVPGDVS